MVAFTDWLTSIAAFGVGGALGWYALAPRRWNDLVAVLALVSMMGCLCGSFIATPGYYEGGPDQFIPPVLAGSVVAGVGIGHAVRSVQRRAFVLAGFAVALGLVAILYGATNASDRQIARRWQTWRRMNGYAPDLCLSSPVFPADLSKFTEHAHDNPLDAWRHPLVYSRSAVGDAATVTSAGRDGVLGDSDDLQQRFPEDCTRDIRGSPP